MVKLAIDREDATAFVGLLCVFFGLFAIYRPVAFIVLGVALIIFAFYSASEPKAAEAPAETTDSTEENRGGA